MLLVGCTDGGDKPAANDTDPTSGDTDPVGGGDTDDVGSADTDVVTTPFEDLPNGSFEADVLENGAYASTGDDATFSGWTTETSSFGYASVWGGWWRSGAWSTLPSPAEGRQYLRLELWNQAQLPTGAEARITSASFGSAVGGASCTLSYALSEIDGYVTPPLSVTVAWSESGSVVDTVDVDVSSATGYDVNSTDGAWLKRDYAFTFPQDADAQPVTVAFVASATNMTPGLALAVLVDNVVITCE